jgi:hypothetical protein
MILELDQEREGLKLRMSARIEEAAARRRQMLESRLNPSGALSMTRAESDVDAAAAAAAAGEELEGVYQYRIGDELEGMYYKLGEGRERERSHVSMEDVSGEMDSLRWYLVVSSISLFSIFATS